MTIHFIGPLLCGGLLALATSAFAENAITPAAPKPGSAGLQIKNIPTGPGDDVKAGGGGGGPTGGKRVTAVKGSKSNSSDRMGGGGGGKGAAGLNPQPEPPGRR
jgi:hypothetical protein